LNTNNLNGQAPSLSDIFDCIYVINLPERTDRRDEIAEQLKSIGLAFDGDRVVLFPAIRPDSMGGFPSVGARGCFLSHLGVLKDANERGLGKILIIEDDFNFSNNFLTSFKYLPGDLIKFEWDIFYGGALNILPDNLRLVTGGVRELPSECPVMGTHCIAIDGVTISLIISYFEKMLKRQPGNEEGGPMHVDGAYSWFRRDNQSLKTLVAVPGIGYQRSSATDVHERKWFDTYFFVKAFVKNIRKIKNKLN
jgi:glycosyl transferase, family 25